MSFRIIEFSKDNRKILASHTLTFRQQDNEKKKEKKAEINKLTEKIESENQKSTLGDLDQLSSLKNDLDTQE